MSDASIILIVRPLEFLFSAVGAALLAKDEAAIKRIRGMAIRSAIVGMIVVALAYCFA